MAEMNNVIDQAAEIMADAGMDTTILEATEKKSSDLLKTALTFVAGTGFGAGCVVLGKKAAQAIRDNKDEIKAEKKKAQIEKLQKQMENTQKKLEELEKAEEPVDDTEEE